MSSMTFSIDKELYSEQKKLFHCTYASKHYGLILIRLHG